MKVINIKYRKASLKEGGEKNLFLGIGVLLSFMIHGAVVAGLPLILAWPEKGDTGVPVVLLLNNSGSPSEQPNHLSAAKKAGMQKLQQRVRQVRPLRPSPHVRNIPPDEKPLVAPQPAATTAVDASASAVPAEAVSRAMADPDSSTSGGEGDGPEKGKGSGEGQGRGLGTGSDGSGTGTGSEGVQGVARGYLDGHFSYLRELILKRLKYPPNARKRGWMGRVTVSFVILESGSVTNLRVLSSSGHRILDENVLQTIRGLGALPKPPVKVQIVLPISYSLD